jgi:hypothetical protein
LLSFIEKNNTRRATFCVAGFFHFLSGKIYTNLLTKQNEYAKLISAWKLQEKSRLFHAEITKKRKEK